MIVDINRNSNINFLNREKISYHSNQVIKIGKFNVFGYHRRVLYILYKTTSKFCRILSIRIDQCNGIQILANISNNSQTFWAIKMGKITDNCDSQFCDSCE